MPEDPLEFFERTGVRLEDPDQLDSSLLKPDMVRPWVSPRQGRTNPELMTNPFWEWLVRTRLSAYQARERFAPDFDESQAHWCFDRLGQPVVALPDGRRLLLAGEHEDHYDPDFHIYNDVVVWHPNGRIEIFGYPEEAFPPTDFHSATLVGDRVILIGNLGYPDRRRIGTTQLAVLDLRSMAMCLPVASGACPGWLHSHTAELEPGGNSIVVRGGMVDPGPGAANALLENADDWRLHLDDWRWERLTERAWSQFLVVRRDGQPLALWRLTSIGYGGSSGEQTAALEELLGTIADPETRSVLQEHLAQQRAWATAREAECAELRLSGLEPDPALLASLYRPDLPDADPEVGSEDEFGVGRVLIGDVRVRYVEGIDEIRVVVEGPLPHDMLSALTDDLCRKLERLHGAPFEVRPLSTPPRDRGTRMGGTE
jgi:hypothetical protein